MAHGARRKVGERVETRDVVIANGGTTSESIGLQGWVLAAIETPAALTSTSLTFTTAQTAAGTYAPIYSDTGSAYSVTVAASRHILIDPSKLVAVGDLKVVMGSAEAAERTLVLFIRKID